MALDSYPDLLTAIANYAFRSGDSDFTATFPTFITLLESRVNRRLRLREQETAATLTLTDGAASLPADYLEFREVRSNGNPVRVLEAVSTGFGTENNPYGDAGASWYFSVSGNTLKTYPSSNSSLTLLYYAKVPALSASAPSNWLLAKAPEVYLYGALLEAQPFMMDDARMAVWGTMFEDAMQALIDADTGAKYAKVARKNPGATP